MTVQRQSLWEVVVDQSATMILKHGIHNQKDHNPNKKGGGGGGGWPWPMKRQFDPKKEKPPAKMNHRGAGKVMAANGVDPKAVADVAKGVADYSYEVGQRVLNEVAGDDDDLFYEMDALLIKATDNLEKNIQREMGATAKSYPKDSYANIDRNLRSLGDSVSGRMYADEVTNAIMTGLQKTGNPARTKVSDFVGQATFGLDGYMNMSPDQIRTK